MNSIQRIRRGLWITAATALPALLFLFLAPASAPAQSVAGPIVTVSDTINPDTIIALSEIKRKPRNALLWSAIPGGGQVYNKRWWKVPLVYTGLLGMVAYADFNQTNYRRFTRALENRCLGDGNIIIPPAAACVPTVDEFPTSSVTNAALLQARANAERARQTAYIGIFIAYVLQAVEAYTDAHLQEFDISDELSLQFGPIAQPDGSLAAGLTVPLGSGRGQKTEEMKVQRLRILGR